MAGMITRRGALVLGAAFAAAGPAPLAAQPKSKLIDQRWTKSGGGTDPDYGPWRTFLTRYLSQSEDGVNRVAYGRAKADGALGPLNEHLAALQAVDPTSLSPEAQKAYWYNLYNIATVALVIEAHPVKSILRIKGGLFNTGPWTEKVLTVNGAALSLDDVEHGILRPVFKDPRTHYAVNCASIGCPNLDPEPWLSSDLDVRLDRAARAYVNHPRGAEVSRGQLTVSKIYSWFEDDFGGSDSGVIDHLRRYAAGDLATALEGVTFISDTRYDWDLNDV